MIFTTGYYCDAEGLTAPVGECAAGFYCETGSNNDSPAECPAGSYCPNGEYSYDYNCMDAEIQF